MNDMQFADRFAYSNVEAETSVLGAAMQDPKALKLVAEMSPEDFTAPEHRLILMAMKDMAKAGTPVDLVTMHDKLSEGKKIDIIGGPAYLARIISFVPTTANVKSYINIVKECAARRQLKTIGEALISASGDSERKIDEIREKAALTIRDVKAGETVKLISQEEALMMTYEKMDEAQKREGKPNDRIMTGIRGLDKRTGGLAGSKLVVIGARPSVGKSIFAMSICMNAAKAGKRVLYVSLEMEADEIMEREFAAASLVPLTEITSNEIQEESWMKLAQSIGYLASQQIFYCTEADTVEDIRKAAFFLFENGGIDLICVDYIQLMEATYARKQNRQEQVAEISRGLKKLAQEMKIPIIALSQLNRSSEKTQTGRRVKRAPTMSEARESGAIEQDANIFILLHDPDVDELEGDELKRTFKNLKDRGMKLIHVNVDKNRQGKKGWFYVAFDGDHMRFLSLSKEDPNEPEQG